jgi:hypothetical protein
MKPTTGHRFIYEAIASVAARMLARLDKRSTDDIRAEAARFSGERWPSEPQGFGAIVGTYGKVKEWPKL